MITNLEALAGFGQLVITGLGIFATAYVALYHLTQLTMLLVAWQEIRRQKNGRHPWDPQQVAESHELPGISIIVPAYNEEISIVRTVTSILASTYPDLEIVVVNDGSTDGTLERLIQHFELCPLTDTTLSDLPSQPVRTMLKSHRHPNLRVIDKLNGGKADALNAGIGLATRPLVCVVDADVLLDRWGLFHLTRPFLENPTTVASSGMIRLSNGCRQEEGLVVQHRLPSRWLERLQVLEYLRAFSVGRMFFNRWGGHLIISGAFGLFRRSVLIAIGGYQPFAIGEDIELVARIHHHQRLQRVPYRIEFVADAVCYTEAPHTAGELGRQRTRWQQGLLTTLRLHRAVLLRPSFGVLGVLVVPYYVLFELLSPLVELAGWLFLLPAWLWGGVSIDLLGGFLAASVGLGAAVSIVAVAIDGLELRHFTRARDTAQLCLQAFLEQLGYHQLTLYFRLRAFPRFYRSFHLRSGWRSPQRAPVAKE